MRYEATGLLFCRPVVFLCEVVKSHDGRSCHDSTKHQWGSENGVEVSEIVMIGAKNEDSERNCLGWERE